MSSGRCGGEAVKASRLLARARGRGGGAAERRWDLLRHGPLRSACSYGHIACFSWGVPGEERGGSFRPLTGHRYLHSTGA